MHCLCGNVGEHERVANLGGMDLVRCKSCRHAELVRVQQARGVEWRDGVGRAVVEVAGEIEVGR